MGNMTIIWKWKEFPLDATRQGQSGGCAATVFHHKKMVRWLPIEWHLPLKLRSHVIITSVYYRYETEFFKERILTGMQTYKNSSVVEGQDRICVLSDVHLDELLWTWLLLKTIRKKRLAIVKMSNIKWASRGWDSNVKALGDSHHRPMMVSTSKFRMSSVSVVKYKQKGTAQECQRSCLLTTMRRYLVQPETSSVAISSRAASKTVAFGEWSVWAESGGKETPSHGGTIKAAHRVTARNVQCLRHEQKRCHSGLVKDSQEGCDWVLRYLGWIAHPQQRLVPCRSSAIRCFPSSTYSIGCWLGDTVVPCVVDESPWEPRARQCSSHSCTEGRALARILTSSLATSGSESDVVALWISLLTCMTGIPYPGPPCTCRNKLKYQPNINEDLIALKSQPWQSFYFLPTIEVLDSVIHGGKTGQI